MNFNGKRCDQCSTIYEAGPQNWETRIVRGVLEIAPRGLFARLPNPDAVQSKDLCRFECVIQEVQTFAGYTTVTLTAQTAAEAEGIEADNFKGLE